jgi:hypothetical protein
MKETALYNAEAYVVVLLLWAYVLSALLRRVRSRRGGLDVKLPIGVAFLSRIAATAAVSLTSLAGTLRGGDEPGILFQAHSAAGTSWGSDQFTGLLAHKLHIWVMAIQIKALDAPDLALRTTQVGLTTVGILLIVLAVHELAGTRAARLTAWILAAEPAGMFFAGILHKEPTMYLAEGLVAYGGAKLWRRGSVDAILPMALGCLIAVATRPYAGWFLIAASIVIILHMSFRAGRRSLQHAVAVLWGIAALVAVSLPVVLHATSTKKLTKIQNSQNANASDKSNLSLERIDYSSRSNIITNLPKRVTDVLLRPYPWQVSNTSQRLGLIGTAGVYIGLVMLFGVVFEARSELMPRAGPLVYLTGMLLVAYSLSAGNAGTAFRYRTHIVAVAVGMIAILWVARRERALGAPRRLHALPPDQLSTAV